MDRRKLAHARKTIRRLFPFPAPLLQSEKTVLDTLAKEGPTNTYQIAKTIALQKTKKNGRPHSSLSTRAQYSLTFKAISRLEKLGMVTLKEKKRTKKETIANIYDLALKGVFVVFKKRLTLVDAERNDDYIRKIIRKYDSLLPLVFGKWSYFIKMNVERMAIARLRLAADNIDRSFERGHSTFPGANIEERISWFFYFYGHYPDQIATDMWGGVADPKAWAKTWKQDEDIRAFVVEKFRDEQKNLEKASIFVKDALAFLEGV